jgi:phenylalanyl-tRNA synthetase alpha subunit
MTVPTELTPAQQAAAALPVITELLPAALGSKVREAAGLLLPTISNYQAERTARRDALKTQTYKTLDERRAAMEKQLEWERAQQAKIDAAAGKAAKQIKAGEPVTEVVKAPVATWLIPLAVAGGALVLILALRK